MKLKITIFRESILFSLFCLMGLSVAIAQGKKYFNPLDENAIQGRLSILNEVKNYGRLPTTSQSAVRGPVWNLGSNSAGLYIEFESDADSIQVQYQVRGGLNMPHMPSTGVSGLDLYSYDKVSKNWEWAFGLYNFKDTITYNFSNIGANENRTYRLYLPLYNTVERLKIGVGSDKKFRFIKKDNKHIIVYGTSIAQGACASRPGLAWTNVVGRNLNHEIINLAFSGNGRLEQPILDLIGQEEAAAFILDCIPNLAITKERSESQLDSLVTHAVQYLRKKHPNTPIILADHSSAHISGFQNILKQEEFRRSSKVAYEAFKKMKKNGVKNLYYVSTKDFGLDINSTVDYAHPNDIGMKKIAEAYTTILNKVL